MIYTARVCTGQIVPITLSAMIIFIENLQGITLYYSEHYHKNRFTNKNNILETL